MEGQGNRKEPERVGTGKGQSIGKSILMITQVGISMLAPIFLGGVIGYWLDRLSETGFWFLVFLLLGFLAAFRNVYKLTRPFYAADLAREKQEQAYWEGLKKKERRESSADAVKNPAGGVTARRTRAAARQEAKPAVQAEDRRLEAEEEFDAWRKRNGRE